MVKSKSDNKKKTKTKDSKKVDTFSLARKAIEKKHGGVITRLSEHEDLKVESISSGSISLDLALGRGGWARGRVYEIYGPNSSGKTTLAATAIVQAQKRGLKACFVDAEHAIDPVLFKSYGVNAEELHVIQAFSGEDSLDALEIIIENGGCDIAVVDSVTSLVPEAELDGTISDQQMGLQARLMSKALRRLTPLVNRTNTLLIFINQIRMKIGNVYGNPETTSGGEALGFYATGIVKVRGGKSKKSRILSKDPGSVGEVVGHEATIFVEKNKLGVPYKEAVLDLIYGYGFDFYKEILSLALGFGIFDLTGSWYKRDGKTLAQGEESMLKLLREDEAFYNDLRNEVIEICHLKEIYEQNS